MSVSIPIGGSTAPSIELCSDCRRMVKNLQKVLYTTDVNGINRFRRLGEQSKLTLKHSVNELKESAKCCRACSFFLVHAHSMIGRVKAKNQGDESGIKTKLDFSWAQRWPDGNIFKLIVGKKISSATSIREEREFTFFTPHGTVSGSTSSMDSHG